MWWTAFLEQVHEEQRPIQQQVSKLLENQQFKFHQINCNRRPFSLGTLSIQVSQPIKPGDDISLSHVCVSAVKHFLSRIGERCKGTELLLCEVPVRVHNSGSPSFYIIFIGLLVLAQLIQSYASHLLPSLLRCC